MNIIDKFKNLFNKYEPINEKIKKTKSKADEKIKNSAIKPKHPEPGASKKISKATVGHGKNPLEALKMRDAKQVFGAPAAPTPYPKPKKEPKEKPLKDAFVGEYVFKDNLKDPSKIIAYYKSIDGNVKKVTFAKDLADKEAHMQEILKKDESDWVSEGKDGNRLRDLRKINENGQLFSNVEYATNYIKSPDTRSGDYCLIYPLEGLEPGYAVLLLRANGENGIKEVMINPFENIKNVISKEVSKVNFSIIQNHYSILGRVVKTQAEAEILLGAYKIGDMRIWFEKEKAVLAYVDSNKKIKIEYFPFKNTKLEDIQNVILKDLKHPSFNEDLIKLYGMETVRDTKEDAIKSIEATRTGEFIIYPDLERPRGLHLLIKTGQETYVERMIGIHEDLLDSIEAHLLDHNFQDYHPAFKKFLQSASVNESGRVKRYVFKEKIYYQKDVAEEIFKEAFKNIPDQPGEIKKIKVNDATYLVSLKRKARTGKSVKINIDRVETIDIIGNGSFGTVTAIERLTSKKTQAMKKATDKKPVGIRDINYEVQLLKEINPKGTVPGLIKPATAFTNGKKVEVLQDGDLEHALSEKNVFFPQFTDKIHACVQLVCGMAHLSANEIVAGDLKPANCLVTKGSKTKPPRVGLSDLGGMRRTKDISALSSVWTPSYVTSNDAHYILMLKNFIKTSGANPKQILQAEKRLKQALDKMAVFSMGCILFKILDPDPNGKFPYAVMKKKYLDNNQKREIDITGAIYFDKSAFKKLKKAIPEEMYSCIEDMLQMDPRERPDIHSLYARFLDSASTINDESLKIAIEDYKKAIDRLEEQQSLPIDHATDILILKHHGLLANNFIEATKKLSNSNQKFMYYVETRPDKMQVIHRVSFNGSKTIDKELNPNEDALLSYTYLSL